MIQTVTRLTCDEVNENFSTFALSESEPDRMLSMGYHPMMGNHIAGSHPPGSHPSGSHPAVDKSANHHILDAIIRRFKDTPTIHDALSIFDDYGQTFEIDSIENLSALIYHNGFSQRFSPDLAAKAKLVMSTFVNPIEIVDSVTDRLIPSVNDDTAYHLVIIQNNILTQEIGSEPRSAPSFLSKVLASIRHTRPNGMAIIRVPNLLIHETSAKIIFVAIQFFEEVFLISCSDHSTYLVARGKKKLSSDDHYTTIITQLCEVIDSIAESTKYVTDLFSNADVSELCSQICSHNKAYLLNAQNAVPVL